MQFQEVPTACVLVTDGLVDDRAVGVDALDEQTFPQGEYGALGFT